MPTDKKISELPIASSINATDVSVLVNGNTDYQYTFTLLLQFLEANLNTGAKMSFGTVLPQNTVGANGDVFVNTASGSFAQKLSGTWTVVYTLPATNAADGTLLYGAGIPSSGTGKNSDSYINTLTGIFYQKSAGTWGQVFSMATGPQGPQGAAGTNGSNGTNGNTILFGSTSPSNTTTGINGNFYINTSTYTLFGPKTAGVWGDGVSLLGAGIPPGGTAGQILKKVDGNDYNAEWQTNSFASLTGAPTDNTNLAAALTAKQDAFGFTPESTSNKNTANGYAGLDSSGKVAAAQLPSYVDDVLEYANFGALPVTGETGKIYVTIDNNKEYRWSGSTYIQLVASPGATDAVPEGTTNLYFTAARVLTSVLTGIGFSSATAITAADTILGALGKLQAQITALFKIPAGGTTGQVLAKVDGTDGNTQWVTPPTGGGSPGGSTNQLQYNNAGAFAGNTNLTYDPSANILYFKGHDYYGLQLDSTNYTCINFQHGGTTYAYIGSGASAHLSGNTDFSIVGSANISIEATNIYLYGSVKMPDVGRLGTGSSGKGYFTYSTFGTSANFTWLYNGSSSGIFGDSQGGLVDAQNVDDWIIGNSGNVVISNNNQHQSGIYAMFNKTNKSLILNGGGIFAPLSSAILQLDTTTQGLLPPRMTTTQKLTISSPSDGLMVYDITLNKLCVYTGSTWETITSV